MTRQTYSLAKALVRVHRCVLSVTGSTRPVSPGATLYSFGVRTPEQLERFKAHILAKGRPGLRPDEHGLAPAHLRELNNRWTLQSLARVLLDSRQFPYSGTTSAAPGADKGVGGRKARHRRVRRSEKFGAVGLRNNARTAREKVGTQSRTINRLAAALDMEPGLVKSIFKELALLAQEVVSRTGEFTVPGFGTLYLPKRKAREGRNPRTAETILIPTAHSLEFRLSERIKQAVAPKVGRSGKARGTPKSLRDFAVDPWREGTLHEHLLFMHAPLKPANVFRNLVAGNLVGAGTGEASRLRDIIRDTRQEGARKSRGTAGRGAFGQPKKGGAIAGGRHGRPPADAGAERGRESSRRRGDAAKVTFNFHAEMNERVIIGQFTNAEVIISREEIERAVGAASKGRQRAAAPKDKMEVEVVPVSNFESVGNFRTTVAPPQKGKPQHLNFGLKATHTGAGEVMVLVYQRQSILVNLVLRPRVVKTLGDGGSVRRAANSRPAPEADRSSRPLHELYIRELNPMPGMIRYLFYMKSPALGIQQDWETEIQMDNRRQYVENIYRNIEEQWGDSEADVDRFAAALRAYGGQLFDELIPKDLKSLLWKHREDIKSIHIISNEPFIPWEIVHLKSPGRGGQTRMPRETKFLGQMGVVRWLLPSAGSPPQRLRIREGRARYVLPKYIAESLKLPEAESEIDFVREKFSARPVPPFEGSLRRLISRPGAFDLLHLACHGHARMDNLSNAQLILQRDFVRGRYVTENLKWEVAQQFANLATDENRPMIVLNACQTGRVGYAPQSGARKAPRRILSGRADYRMSGLGGFARAFIEKGAGAFVGTLWNIGDNPARTFIETLYTQLLDGSTLAQATVKAREKARLAGDATWLAYVVYGHPHMKLVR